MTKKMFVNLDRCIGCWTCAMSCKMANGLDDDDYRVTVHTNGSGAGIDRPMGTYPELKMNWMPLYKGSCTFCPGRVKDGKAPHCAYNCPTNALAFGDDADADGAFCQALNEAKGRHFHVFELPAYSESRANIVYGTRE